MMSIVDVVYYFRESADMHRIKEVKINQVYGDLPFNSLKRSLGIFMLEILRGSIREVESNPVMYNFIKSHFVRLDEAINPSPNYHLLFLLELTRLLGFFPSMPSSGDEIYFNMMDGNFDAYVSTASACPEQGRQFLVLSIDDLSV